MKQPEPYQGFEQGPIRPPSEAASLLIRITRNCPWNRCTFCPVYKSETFSLRPVAHVLRDIDTVKECVEQILQAKRTGPARYGDFNRAATSDEAAFQAAYHFVAGGMKSIFLQDGNSLIIKPLDLINILKHLSTSFPMVERITSYGRSRTIARISDEHLQQMAEAGLNRIHIGMESGSDTVLKMVKKGVDKKTQILAGQKVKRAGMELSEYFMPGLGGKKLSGEHAAETADALNQINPDFIRLRSLALPGSAPLTAQYEAGEFNKLGEVDTARELRHFLGSLTGITSAIRSDHILNLFHEIDGQLPGDRQKMLDSLDAFLALGPEEQMIFCIGRRSNRMSHLADLNDPRLRDSVLAVCESHGITPDNMDEVIQNIMQRFI